MRKREGSEIRDGDSYSSRRIKKDTGSHDLTVEELEGVNDSLFIPRKPSPVVVFSHGAGAPSSSEWMIRWKGMLMNHLHAAEVITFDYPYMCGVKRKAPPKAEKLVGFHSDVVKKAGDKYPGHPLILAGKSMGSRYFISLCNLLDTRISMQCRVSCMVANEGDLGIAAVVCLGYPLKGVNGKFRDETLLQLKVPTMFVQGSKDGLCPLEKLEGVRKEMDAMNGSHVINGGDHSFKIPLKQLEKMGSTQDKVEHEACEAIATFISKNLGC